MINQQLLDYIRQQIQQGVSREQITNSLAAQGWRAQDIEEGFNSLAWPIQSQALSDTLSQSFSSSPSKKINKALLAIIFIIGGALIIGGGAFAYFHYFQSPEKIIQRMIANMAEITSLEYSGEINIKAYTDDLLDGGDDFLSAAPLLLDKKESNFSINFTGTSDIQDPNNPKGQFAFNIRTDALPQEEFTLGFEAKTVDKIIYIRINDVPDIEPVDLSVIENQWIKIDIEAIEEQLGLEEQINRTRIEQGLTPEEIEKLKTAFQQAKIFEITERLVSEKINGVNAHRYKFTIDRDGIRKLFIDISQVLQDQALTEQELADLDESLEEIELFEGEIWIGKRDLLPYKITLNIMIKGADELIAPGQINFTLLLKNFNQPVQISVPPQAKPLEEFLSELFVVSPGSVPGDIMPPADQQGFDKDTDRDGLSDRLEIIYGTNLNKADTDGDGFQDGAEVEHGYNPDGPGRLLR